MSVLTRAPPTVCMTTPGQIEPVRSRSSPKTTAKASTPAKKTGMKSAQGSEAGEPGCDRGAGAEPAPGELFEEVLERERRQRSDDGGEQRRLAGGTGGVE